MKCSKTQGERFMSDVVVLKWVTTTNVILDQWHYRIAHLLSNKSQERPPFFEDPEYRL